MQLSAAQLDSWRRSNRRINIWHGPVRSGKTVVSIIRWLHYLEQEAPPGGDLYMIGRTFGALRRNVLMPMEQLVGNDYQYYSGKGMARLWNRNIHMIGMHDVRAELLIRGSTSAGTYGDEVTTWPESAFKMAMTRLSLPGSKFLGTTNPDNPRHYLKTEYIDRSDELDLAEFTWPITENPFLTQDYLDAVMAEYTGLFFKRFILGEWVAAEGAVYGMLDNDIHVKKYIELVPDQYIVGVDYGTSVPMVFLMIGVHYPHHGKPIAWVERECYYDPVTAMAYKTDSEHAVSLMKFLNLRDHRDVPISAIYCDPSAASFRTECAKCGIRAIRDIDCADNAVVDGISTVSTLLATGRLWIHERCEQTLTEFGGYVWDPKAQLRGEDAPKKQGDHAMDALRYALHTHLGESLALTQWMAGVRGG
jgi:PBSX family phage terminase large subunit